MRGHDPKGPGAYGSSLQDIQDIQGIIPGRSACLSQLKKAIRQLEAWDEGAAGPSARPRLREGAYQEGRTWSVLVAGPTRCPAARPLARVVHPPCLRSSRSA